MYVIRIMRFVSLQEKYMLSTIWNAWSEFWNIYGPWIGAGLIPTIITGLSMSPSTERAVPILQKAWEAFKQFMAILSFLTHKDQPGTFKVPLVPVKKDVGALIVLFIVLSSLSPGCSWLSSATKDVKEDVIDCTVKAVDDNASDLLPIVLSVLSGNTENWRSQLASLSKQFGAEATACSLDKIAKRLQSPKIAGSDGSEAERARLYIAEQNWKILSK